MVEQQFIKTNHETTNKLLEQQHRRVVSCQRYVTGPNLNGAPCPVDGRGGSERLKGSSVERLKFVSNICFSINNFLFG